MGKTPWFKTVAMVVGIVLLIISIPLHLGIIPMVVGALLVGWYLKKAPAPKT